MVFCKFSYKEDFDKFADGLEAVVNLLERE